MGSDIRKKHAVSKDILHPLHEYGIASSVTWAEFWRSKQIQPQQTWICFEFQTAPSNWQHHYTGKWNNDSNASQEHIALSDICTKLLLLIEPWSSMYQSASCPNTCTALKDTNRLMDAHMRHMHCCRPNDLCHHVRCCLYTTDICISQVTIQKLVQICEMGPVPILTEAILT